MVVKVVPVRMMCRAVQAGSSGDRQVQQGMPSSTMRRPTPHNYTAAAARAVASVNERSTAMGGKMDQVKGRIKEAAGVLTDGSLLWMLRQNPIARR